MSFRFDSKTVTTLHMLERKLFVSKTSLLEKALQNYAKETLSKTNKLLEYAGILARSESDEMLRLIRGDKKSKKIKVDL